MEAQVRSVLLKPQLQELLRQFQKWLHDLSRFKFARKLSRLEESSGSEDQFQRKGSIVASISLLYAILTIINLLIFWIATGSNQIQLITRNTLLQSQTIAFEVLRNVQPLMDDADWRKSIRSDNPVSAAEKIEKRIAALKNRNELSLTEFKLISTVNEIIYPVQKSKDQTLPPDQFRKILQAVQIREIKGQAFYGVPDILNYRVSIFIPLTATGARDIVLQGNVTMTSIRREVRSLISLALSMIAIMTVVQTGFGIFIYKKFIAPVKKITSAAVVVADGDLNARVSVNNRDEIGQLAHLFNNMVASLRQKTDELMNVIQELTRRKKEMENDLELGENIQSEMLPPPLVSSHVRVATYYKALSKVSGDYYEYVYLPDGSIGILLADAMGHGVPAAFMTIMAKIHFGTLAARSNQTSEVMQQLSQELEKILMGTMYLTGFYIIIQPDLKMKYTSSGHMPSLLFRRQTGDVEEFTTSGFFLGIGSDIPNEQQETQLAAGDRILLFTDGISEARNPNDEMFGPERIKQFLIDHKDTSLEETRDRLLDVIRDFSQGVPVDDDVTYLLIEVGTAERSADQWVRARTYFEEGRYRECLEILSQIPEENYVAAMDLYRGYCLVRLFDFSSALPVLEKLLNEYSTDFEFQLNLGLCYFQSQRFTDSVVVLKRAVQLQPVSVFAHKCLMAAMEKEGTLEEYEPVLRLALQRNITNLEFYRFATKTLEKIR